ncbi:nuclear transport factor 2 family protein [Isoptericola croceus]|uniref:nuclear transport factor 2 family protein n=1 Tax=Isoptericola croceus TaxID=3031406 RepID=UPI0023F6A04D|nr:nuclear transport factor 2 family protein [Isoptericola croceus]
MSVDDDTLAIVEEYHRAWTGGDVDRALKLVADDFVCHAPGERLDGKEAWRAYLAGFAPGLTGVTEVSRLADGAGHVVQLYYPHTAATRSAAAAEYLTVRDGLLVENVLVFDRLSYGPPPGE